VNVYKPTGDLFPGPDVAGLETGTHYDEWVPNDHCFVKADDGRWHCFGITHPRTATEFLHAGENQSFHAVAPAGALPDVILDGAWQDAAKILTAPERPGEPDANHAPHIVRDGQLYRMFYGPTPIRAAVSTDLYEWRPTGPVDGAPEGRDPMVVETDDGYQMIVCGRYDVRAAVSQDLADWQPREPVLRMDGNVDPESPFMVRREDGYYLFVCGWDGVWDRQDLAGAYQHTTYVFHSPNPLHFDGARPIATLQAHAPEIIRGEAGEWYVSSVEWPHRGVSIAPLAWE
jgi:beta-fructofuranosidase